MRYAIVCLLLVGCAQDRTPILVAAKDKLLRIHPLWRPVGYGSGNSFILRGYLTSRADDKVPDGEIQEMLALPLNELKSHNPDARWKGVVFASVLHPNDLWTKNGWYEHVLVKNGMFFYGDPDMLREIDRDL